MHTDIPLCVNCNILSKFSNHISIRGNADVLYPCNLVDHLFIVRNFYLNVPFTETKHFSIPIGAFKQHQPFVTNILFVEVVVKCFAELS